MSLEEALRENTEVMKQLITVMSSAAHAAAPADKPARSKKTETSAPTAAPAVAETQAPAVDSLGNPAGTRYIDVPAHFTVAAIKPGDHFPNLPSQVEISAEQYTAKKAEYAKKALTPAAETAAAAPAVAATPATGEPSATPQPATASAGSPEPSFADVVNKCRELHGAKGNDGLAAFLAKHGAERVPALQGKAPNADLIAQLNAEIESAKLGL